jgi:hypothetical protein
MWRMRFSYWLTKATNRIRIFNTHCFSTATMATRSCLCCVFVVTKAMRRVSLHLFSSKQMFNKHIRTMCIWYNWCRIESVGCFYTQGNEWPPLETSFWPVKQVSTLLLCPQPAMYLINRDCLDCTRQFVLQIRRNLTFSSFPCKPSDTCVHRSLANPQHLSTTLHK